MAGFALSALRCKTHHRVFKDLPQVVVEVVGLVVLCGQDAAKCVYVGHQHEDTLGRCHSQSNFGLLSSTHIFFDERLVVYGAGINYAAGYLALCLQPCAVFISFSTD